MWYRMGVGSDHSWSLYDGRLLAAFNELAEVLVHAAAAHPSMTAEPLGSVGTSNRGESALGPDGTP